MARRCDHFFEIRHAFAQSFNMARDFMAGNERERGVRSPVSFNGVQVTVANAAGFDLDEHFAGAGFRPRYGFNCKSYPDLAEHGGLHGFAQD